MMHSKLIVATAIVWILGTSTTEAQWTASVTGGTNTGGAADQTYPRAGLSLGWWKDNIGVEVEAGIIPLFFESEPGDEVEMVLTAIPRVLLRLRPPTDGATPFVFGGVGVVSYALTDSEDRFEHGRTHGVIGVGGGAMAFISDRFGLRGEVQYIRALADTNPPGNFRWDHTRLHFWTFGGGLIIRF